VTHQAKRCHHCSREVRPTIHTRSGARVDYYRMMTGPTRSETLENPRNPGETLRVLRVEQLHELITCAECWEDPAVRAALEGRFRSGAECA
jgi:hypothetical protein